MRCVVTIAKIKILTIHIGILCHIDIYIYIYIYILVDSGTILLHKVVTVPGCLEVDDNFTTLVNKYI